MAFNVLELFYFYFVIVTFRSFGFCKFCMIVIMLMEWLVLTGCTGLYYYTFHLFWNDYLRDNREKSVYYDEQHEYELFWCPDWGIIVILIIEWYMIKLILYIYKAM